MSGSMLDPAEIRPAPAPDACPQPEGKRTSQNHSVGIHARTSGSCCRDPCSTPQRLQQLRIPADVAARNRVGIHARPRRDCNRDLPAHDVRGEAVGIHARPRRDCNSHALGVLYLSGSMLDPAEIATAFPNLSVIFNGCSVVCER